MSHEEALSSPKENKQAKKQLFTTSFAVKVLVPYIPFLLHMYLRTSSILRL